MNFLQDLISLINQCDDLPPECFDGTGACTCQSFLTLFFLIIGVLGAVGVLSLVRMLPSKSAVKDGVEGS